MSNITSISQVPCPSCKQKGKDNYLIESAGRYGCPECNLWFPNTFLGYKLTPQNVYDMLYSGEVGLLPKDKETGEQPTIKTRWTPLLVDAFVSKRTGKKFSAQLAFVPGTDWKFVLKFPERTAPEPTGRLCPECQRNGRNGMLVIRESTKGKFVGCDQYPVCKYTERYAPFVFQGVDGDPSTTSPPSVPPAE
jgi:ssDNA-binding Zn-finger/Zn-ribbon topoisomerase 1